LPQAFDLVAPAHWRSVDLVSDLHLCDALPQTFAAFSRYLNNTTADAVLILGDLFEVWVGDDMAQQGFERDCVALLAQVSQRRDLGFMVGNRDFLAGPALRASAGLLHLPDPTVLTFWGQRVLLSHGDALCLSDTPYQAFRAEVRAPAWQSAFLARPLAVRQKIAADIRHASKTRRQFDGAADADLDEPETLRWLAAAGSSTLVHGHTHRPDSHQLPGGAQRHVLSDWDLDHASRAEVLRIGQTGIRRLTPQQACAAP
jgi:UDP-2,3-diacylglucosamine hydrolase